MNFHAYFLVAISVIILFVILSLFIKKRKTIIIVEAILVLGLFMVVDITKKTSFTELYGDYVNDESNIESISITIKELVNDYPEAKARITIKNPEMIESILDDFSNLKLKKSNPDSYDREYTIKIVTTKKVKEEVFESDFVTLEIDDNYLYDYKIISDTDHLKSVKELLESDEADWVDLNSK